MRPLASVKTNRPGYRKSRSRTVFLSQRHRIPLDEPGVSVEQGSANVRDPGRSAPKLPLAVYEDKPRKLRTDYADANLQPFSRHVVS